MRCLPCCVSQPAQHRGGRESAQKGPARCSEGSVASSSRTTCVASHVHSSHGGGSARKHGEESACMPDHSEAATSLCTDMTGNSNMIPSTLGNATSLSTSCGLTHLPSSPTESRSDIPVLGAACHAPVEAAASVASMGVSQSKQARSSQDGVSNLGTSHGDMPSGHVAFKVEHAQPSQAAARVSNDDRGAATGKCPSTAAAGYASTAPKQVNTAVDDCQAHDTKDGSRASHTALDSTAVAAVAGELMAEAVAAVASGQRPPDLSSTDLWAMQPVALTKCRAKLMARTPTPIRCLKARAQRAASIDFGSSAGSRAPARLRGVADSLADTLHDGADALRRAVQRFTSSTLHAVEAEATNTSSQHQHHSSHSGPLRRSSMPVAGNTSVRGESSRSAHGMMSVQPRAGSAGHSAVAVPKLSLSGTAQRVPIGGACLPSATGSVAGMHTATSLSRGGAHVVAAPTPPTTASGMACPIGSNPCSPQPMYARFNPDIEHATSTGDASSTAHALVKTSSMLKQPGMSAVPAVASAGHHSHSHAHFADAGPMVDVSLDVQLLRARLEDVAHATADVAKDAIPGHVSKPEHPALVAIPQAPGVHMHIPDLSSTDLWALQPKHLTRCQAKLITRTLTPKNLGAQVIHAHTHVQSMRNTPGTAVHGAPPCRPASAHAGQALEVGHGEMQQVEARPVWGSSSGLEAAASPGTLGERLAGGAGAIRRMLKRRSSPDHMRVSHAMGIAEATSAGTTATAAASQEDSGHKHRAGNASAAIGLAGSPQALLASQSGGCESAEEQACASVRVMPPSSQQHTAAYGECDRPSPDNAAVEEASFPYPVNALRARSPPASGSVAYGGNVLAGCDHALPTNTSAPQRAPTLPNSSAA